MIDTYLREKFLVEEDILCCNQFEFPRGEGPVFLGEIIKRRIVQQIQGWNIYVAIVQGGETRNNL